MRIVHSIISAVIMFAVACDGDAGRPTTSQNVSLDRAESTTPGVRVYQFRTEEDPNVTGAAAFCATAPFTANVLLNASAWATQTRASDGKIVNEGVRQVGTVVACAQLTNFAFPPGLQQNFAARFDLTGGSFTAVGTCTLISNDVPVPNLVLAGCALKVRAGEGTAGGMATSASVFNPRQVAGFQTGSYWTLQVYDAQ
jgi:hypothetical protein